MKPIARIVVRAGGEGILFLRPGRYVLGRGSDCDLILCNPAVSRRHAAIEVVDRVATLVDLSSQNGTRVNGETADRVPLTHGAKVRIGTATCVFEWLDPFGFDDDLQTPPMHESPPADEPDLTPAEQRVLTCLLGGLAEKAVAAKLSVSRHTVHNHVKRIYAAYGVGTRSELLAKFIARAGLV